MTPLGAGLFEAWVPGVGNGALHYFLIGDRQLPDPLRVFCHRGCTAWRWSANPAIEWRYEAPSLPLREHLIYDLHIGTFTTAG
jgi:1,4-alpha-glucan branching enzyme